LAPAAVVLLILAWLITFKISRYVSVASIVAAALLPPIVIFGAWYHGKIAAGTWNKPLFVFSVVVAVLAIWKHRGNIQRLMNGTENRFQPKKKTNA
jgi:acyl phosphate:glycerol-3-phosphate acyltransferase